MPNITTSQVAELRGLANPDAARSWLRKHPEIKCTGRDLASGEKLWPRDAVLAAPRRPRGRPRNAEPETGSSPIRVQIQYHTGPAERPSAWGWLTIDRQCPPADEAERREWARGKVADDIHLDAAEVKVLAIHVGTVATLADVDRYGP